MERLLGLAAAYLRLVRSRERARTRHQAALAFLSRCHRIFCRMRASGGIGAKCGLPEAGAVQSHIVWTSTRGPDRHEHPYRAWDAALRMVFRGRWCLFRQLTPRFRCVCVRADLTNR